MCDCTGVDASAEAVSGARLQFGFGLTQAKVSATTGASVCAASTRRPPAATVPSRPWRAARGSESDRKLPPTIPGPSFEAVTGGVR